METKIKAKGYLDTAWENDANGQSNSYLVFKKIDDSNFEDGKNYKILNDNVSIKFGKWDANDVNNHNAEYIGLEKIKDPVFGKEFECAKIKIENKFIYAPTICIDMPLATKFLD